MARHSSANTVEGEEDWIGVDWGTTNCAVAIYSRSFGRTKWMRLGPGTTISGSEGERRRWKQSYQLTEQQKNGKVGRIMPSVLVFASTTNLPIFKGNDSSSNERSHVKLLQLSNNNSSAYYPWYNVSDLLSQQRPLKECQQLWACVGAAAELFISAVLVDGDNLESKEKSKVFSATVRSVKRLVLKELASRTTKFLESKTSTIHETTNSISVAVLPLGCDEMVHLDAVTIAAIFLRAIRFASDDYLRQPKVRQKLGLSPHPSDAGLSRQHCCLGVPATASLAYRSFLQEAAQRAGFLSSTCITESTAAAIAYGLFTRDRFVVSDPAQKDVNETLPKTLQTIVVFDMGGGTTDITIAEREIVPQNFNKIVVSTDKAENMDFHVCVTVGNDELGGDDMDLAILRLVRTKLKQKPVKDDTVDANQLLLLCRAAKLLLCGGENGEIATTVSVNVLGASISISQDEFVVAIQQILDRTRKLIQTALERYEEKRGSVDTKIDEVILIGGASRVPAIRELLREIFIDQPNRRTEKCVKGGLSELCTSVNAMSAVAQGCAVSAALVSGTVPFHELKSSYMLDTTPYSIGVLLNPGAQKSGLVDDDDTLENSSSTSFVEILPQGASLPAAGYATFVLADVGQAGISLIAAEQIGDSSATDTNQKRYNVLGEFTFLLHRLSKSELTRMKVRSVDVGMTLKENGEFVVSIFDQNDPDHIRKKEWYQKVKRAEKTGSAAALLDMNNELHSSDVILPWEQALLLLSCVVLLLVYVAAKITFTDPASILTVAE
jgi:molecular chaperone DnaK (HSP70)